MYTPLPTRILSLLAHSSLQYRLFCPLPVPHTLLRIPPLLKKMSSTTPDLPSSNGGTAATLQSDPELGAKVYIPRYIDTGINLTDQQYMGEYHGKKVYPSLRRRLKTHVGLTRSLGSHSRFGECDPTSQRRWLRETHGNRLKPKRESTCLENCRKTP